MQVATRKNYADWISWCQLKENIAGITFKRWNAPLPALQKAFIQKLSAIR
jgi:hypothetical protein